MKKIYLAGGCFWGVEHFLSLIPGIVQTTVGYANSDIASPSYEDLKAHRSLASETVEVIYDETKISLKEILDLFFNDLAKKYDKPILTELLPLQNFTIAEEYHQDYLIKNPDGYCHVDPKMFAIARNYKKG